VWNAVDTHARKSHTSIIHGKWAHEETIATASFATTYLIVKNLKEARRTARGRASAAPGKASAVAPHSR
jgi:4-hydroxy-3-methylbut-2-enyl diphosphate reductase IspH